MKTIIKKKTTISEKDNLILLCNKKSNLSDFNLTQAELSHIKNKFKNISSYGSIGCEYFDIVCGIRDFALLSRLYPWDHIPGVFIVRQAGGHDCHFDKLEYKFYENSKNLVVSCSKNLNYEILNLIGE